MNKYILMVIDHQLNPDKYTQSQLDENAADAYYTSVANGDDYNATGFALAAGAAIDASLADSNDYFWLNDYFIETRENKQDYIEAINKDNKQ